jgi:hypothetical protein
MKPTGRDIQWYYDIGQALLGEKLTSEERDLLTWQLADIKHLVAKVLACGRAAEPLIFNFVELNTVMVFISTVAGLVWRFHSKGYHQADIMREGKAAMNSSRMNIAPTGRARGFPKPSTFDWWPPGSMKSKTTWFIVGFEN